MANRPIFPGSINNAALLVENGDAVAAQDFITAGAKGSRIDSISVTSDDTVNIDLIVSLNDGTVDHVIARIPILAGSGTDGINPPVSLLNITDMPFLGEDLSYSLKTGNKITIAAQTAVTAAKKITLVAIVGDY